jgi:outer membrane protein TolC
MPNPHDILRSLAALAIVALAPAAARAAPLRIDEAIRAAWERNEGLRASASGVAAARADAARARDARLPTLSFLARGVRTDQPMMAFGLKLDQGRIGPEDFDPARLNDPAAIGGWGAGAAVSVPLFMGGRLAAGQRAAGAMANAEAATHERRRDELAVAVVEAYFGTQVAEEGVRYAEELVAHAAETEHLVRKRNAEGLALDADAARATAFRAQAEADRAAALQRRASARSALALLTGLDAASLELVTPVGEVRPSTGSGRTEEGEAPVGEVTAGPSTGSGRTGEGEAPVGEGRPSTGSGRTEVGMSRPSTGSGRTGQTDSPAAERAGLRPDLEAARLRRDAAEAGVTAARGSLLPAVFAQASAETMRTGDLDEGTSWTVLGLVARWDLSLADARATSAARARAQAAEDALAWEEHQARREGEEARTAVETADARVASAREAVAASESARALRAARHREGLLPLTDVLDAEAGLAGARALLLASRLEARVSRARLALATNHPIEGLTP